MKDKISIVVPTKNEGVGLGKFLESLLPYGEDILVVDGHSTDNTREIVKKYPQVRFLMDNGRGKGDGIRVGIKAAKKDIVVFIDADGSHEPADIPKLVKPILDGESDMVIASRAKGGSDEFKMDLENLIRQVGSDFATTIINYRWRTNLTDIQNGFRAVKRSTIQGLPLVANDFDIEEEMVMKTLKQGYKISEIGSHEYSRQWGSSKLQTSKAWKFLYRLFIEIITN